MFMRRAGLRLALVLVLFASAGCGSFWSIADTDGSLEDSMRTYTKLVRWGEIERASLFVDESLRADFLALASGFDRLRFTDFDIGPVDQTPEGEVRVTVVYRVYDLSTLVEREIVENQSWTADGERRWTGEQRWSVTPDLSGFQEAVGQVSAPREPSG
jgi:hypothetical protein